MDVFASFLTYFYVNLTDFFDQSKIYKKFMIFYLCYVENFDSESRHFGMHAWVAAQAGEGHAFRWKLIFETLPALSAARPAPPVPGRRHGYS